MRRRILASMVLVTFVAVVAFAVPLGFAAASVYREREVSRLERTATKAEGALSSAALPLSGSLTSNNVMPVHPPDVQLALYDVHGARLTGQGPASADAVALSALAGRIDNDHDGAWLAVAIPIHDEQNIIGAVRVASPWSTVTANIYRSWLVMAAFGGLAVALAAALARWQSTRLVEPVDALAQMALRLGDGDLAARLERTGVAELDRAADALNRTATRLGEIIGRERAFTADVSHQLNTPLTSLRLGLESALLTPGSDSTAALRAAVSEVERLQTTVATLLAVARDQVTTDARCSLAAATADAADRARPRLGAAGRPLRVNIDSAVPLVRCPPDVVREILAVLLDNALHHGAGTVTITGRRAGLGAVVEVSDEGDGVAEPANIFQRRSPEANGHGIGLALARSLAEAHESRLQLTRRGPSPVFTLALAGSSE